MDISKPIAFAEHLQLSSLGVQPASISFQVHTTQSAHLLHLLTWLFTTDFNPRV
jgi:clathrin heavy chain